MMAINLQGIHCSPNDEAVRFFTLSLASSRCRNSSSSVAVFWVPAMSCLGRLLGAVSVFLFLKTPRVNSPVMGALYPPKFAMWSGSLPFTTVTAEHGTRRLILHKCPSGDCEKVDTGRRTFLHTLVLGSFRNGRRGSPFWWLPTIIKP